MLKQNRIPSPRGVKKEELKLRSINNIVIPPAKTGNANKSKKVVITNLQTKRENLSRLINFIRKTKIVVKKLIELRIEEAPAKCKEKITKSKDLLKISPDRGG